MTTISEAASQLGISPHTLRYYEKIKLIPPVSKSEGGRRNYSKSDIVRVQFIKRAQRMQFSLDEIKSLIDLDRSNAAPKPPARALVAEKLTAIEENLNELQQLKQDLTQMLDACVNSSEYEVCPIIEGLKKAPSEEKSNA